MVLKPELGRYARPLGRHLQSPSAAPFTSRKGVHCNFLLRKGVNLSSGPAPASFPRDLKRKPKCNGPFCMEKIVTAVVVWTPTSEMV